MTSKGLRKSLYFSSLTISFGEGVITKSSRGIFYLNEDGDAEAEELAL